jgi:hypothetical protein
MGGRIFLFFVLLLWLWTSIVSSPGWVCVFRGPIASCTSSLVVAALPWPAPLQTLLREVPPRWGVGLFLTEGLQPASSRTAILV